jgi:cytochrome P450
MALGHEDPEYQTESGSALDTRQQGTFNLGTYCAKLATERRGGIGDDLLSVLGNAEVNGRKLTETELMHNGFLYIVGGLETTRNAISGGLLAFINYPARMGTACRQSCPDADGGRRDFALEQSNNPYRPCRDAGYRYRWQKD